MNISSIANSAAITGWTSNKGVQKILSDIGNESKLLPVALLELGVQTGRSYHAQKRGGYYEFKETLLEGALAAAVWMGGIKILNKVGDLAFEKLLGINTSVDWKQVPDLAKGRLNPDKFMKLTYGTKFLKLVASVGLSIYTVGVLIPKYKQKLTRESIQRKKKEEAIEKSKSSIKPHVLENINKSLLSTKSDYQIPVNLPENITVEHLKVLADSPLHGTRFMGHSQKGNEPSFTGAMNILTKVGYALENQTIPQLAVIDTGITGGRIINARNKDEAIEIFFRDSASSMFYYFCIPLISRGLAGMFDAKLGIHTALDPKAMDPVSQAFKQRIFDIAKANKGVIGIDDIQKAIMGTSNTAVSDAVKNALLKSSGQTLTPDQVKTIVSNIDDFLPKAIQGAASASKSQIARELQAYLAGVSKRAVIVAQSQAQSATSSSLRSLANLMDDVARTQPASAKQVQAAAKSIQELSNKAYAQVQTGKGLDANILKQVEQAIRSLGKTNLDDQLMLKINQGLKTVQASSSTAGYITKEALEEVIKGGLTRDSNFLKQVLANVNGKVVGDPTKYVSPAEHKTLQQAVDRYAKRVISQLEKSVVIKPGEKISIDKIDDVLNKTIAQSKNKNILFKGLYLAAGLALAIFCLSWAIPKAQYLITKMRTGKDSFPGVAGLLDDETKTNKPFKPVNPETYSSGSQPFDLFVKQKFVQKK
jgi:hypothetical protein